MMLFFVISVLLAALIIVWQTYRVAAAGRATARLHTKDAVEIHRRMVWQWVALLIAAVCLLELQLRVTVGILETNLVLRYVHYTIDVVFVVLAGMVIFPFNGEKSRYHRWLVYPLLPIFFFLA